MMLIDYGAGFISSNVGPFICRVEAMSQDCKPPWIVLGASSRTALSRLKGKVWRLSMGKIHLGIWLG